MTLNKFFTVAANLDPSISLCLLAIIGLLLTIIAIRVIFSKDLLETIIIMSVFSLLISLIYLIMDAPDVAMTEIALGACLSTCVLLNFIRIVGVSNESLRFKNVVIPLMLCLSFIVILTIAGLDLPQYGNGDSAVQTHVSKYYIDNTSAEIGVKSMVAAILASYRGFDTLGETSVILIAGLAVLLILSKRTLPNAQGSSDIEGR